MIPLSKFVQATRYAINRTYIGATKAPFCFVPPKARPTVTPVTIRYPLRTGTDKAGNAVLVKDAATERFRVELNEQIGTLFRQYVRANKGDARTIPAQLVSFTSAPFGIEIPNPDPPDVLPWRSIDGASAYRLPLGYSFDTYGENLEWWQRDAGDAHAIIAGATRSGKSVTIRSLAASLIAAESPDDLEIVPFDLKRRALVALESAPHVRVPLAYTKEMALALLVALDNEQNRRIEELVDHPTIAVILDELTDILEGDDEAQAIFSRLARKGAELGIFILAGTQKPMISELGQGNSQLTMRVVGRMKTGRDAKLVAGADIDADRLRYPGTFYIVSGRGEPVQIRTTYIDDAQMEQVIAHAWQRWPSPSPSVLDVPSFAPGTTGKAAAKAAERLAQAEEDLARLLDEFGEELEEVSMSKRIEAIGLTPKGNHWTKGKKRVEEALELYYQRETV